MNRNILQCLLWLLLPAATFAQQTDTRTRTERRAERRERINKLARQEEEGALIYQKQNVFGVRLYSDGYSAMFEKGFLKTATRTTLFSVELGERKHPKEDKSSNDLFGVNAYIYGKENNFYFAKLGIGQSLLIGGKGNRNGVAVSAIGKGGLSVGLLKPYYLDVLIRTSSTQNAQRQVKYVEGDTANNNLFLGYTGGIQRSSGLFKGFGEMKVRPGLFAQAGLRFDWGHYNETVTAVEAGINAEYYASKIPQMVLQKERNLFLNLYVTIEFGKRK